MLRVVLMKWCLSGKFDLKDVVPAISGSTLNPTIKSAAISQNIERSRSTKIYLWKEIEKTSQLMMTVYITLKKVIILKVSLENKTITKIKTTAKTLLKISCPVIVSIQQNNLIFTCGTIWIILMSAGINYYAMVRYVRRKVVTFTAYFAMRKTFRQNIILKDI